MANIAQLSIQINSNGVTPAITALNNLNTAGQQAQTTLNNVGTHGTQSLNNVGNSAKYAAMNIGRVVQDAPYGLMGVMNNVDQLAESFVRLRNQTGGSTQTALKAIISSLAGPSGILLGISVIGSLAVAFGDKLVKAINKGSESVDELKKKFQALEQFKNLSIQLDIVGLEGVSKLQAELKELEQRYNLITLQKNKVFADEAASKAFWGWKTTADDISKAKTAQLKATKELEKAEISLYNAIIKGEETVGKEKDIELLIKYGKLTDKQAVSEWSVLNAKYDLYSKNAEITKQELEDKQKAKIVADKEFEKQRKINEEKAKSLAFDKEALNVNSSIVYGAKGSGLNNFSKLTDDFEIRLRSAIREFKNKTGVDLQINSSWRSKEDQELLYNSLKAKNPNAIVAKPGSSRHEKGLAIDISASQIKQFAPIAEKYGLVNPIAGDRVHFQMAKAAEGVNLLTDAINDNNKSNKDAEEVYNDLISSLDDEILRLRIGEKEYRIYSAVKKAGLAFDSEEANAIREKINLIEKLTEEQDRLAKSQTKHYTLYETLVEGFKDWTQSLGYQLNELAWNADASFGDIVKSFENMITQILIEYYVVKPILESLGVTTYSNGGTFSKNGSLISSANGNAFYRGNLTAFASGGAFTNKIVSSPTLFDLGLMGEAGAEAIMPLTRIGNSLGVKALVGGSQAPNIGINIVNNTGSKISEKTETQFDGQQFVITTVLEAVSSNKGGTKDTLKALLKQ